MAEQKIKKRMKPVDSGNFDSLTCRLSGSNIIEASAGTGKTFNIENLFSRLLLICGHPVDSILVVTFTEAATKELITRIRSMLYKLKRFYNTGEYDEERIKTIAEESQYEDSEGKITEISTDEKKRRLALAIQNFDEVSIFTIHGFCNRMLNDYAFESGMLFNVSLETNADPIVQDIIEDFWRSEFYNDDLLKNLLITLCSLSINGFIDFIDKMPDDSDVKIVPLQPKPERFEEIRTSFNNLKNEWNRDEIEALLSSACLNKPYNSKYSDIISDACDNVIELFNGKCNNETLKSLNFFTYEEMQKKVPKRGDGIIPQHPFFQAISDFKNELVDFALIMKYRCRQYFHDGFNKRKSLTNIQTFDGMLKDVANEVVKQDSPLLMKIRQKFNAALIDEFQDTDSIQYGIFKKVFIDAGKTLFVVGDPKQAIYAFRGGDIYTYMLAKKENTDANIGSLDRNWRSCPALVSAVNSLFRTRSDNPRPFVNDFIKYEDISSDSRNNRLLIDGKEDGQPFKFIYFQGEYNAGSLLDDCCKRTAVEIYELLSENNHIMTKEGDKRNIRPSDITVLVASHRQARKLKPELEKRNIPVVLQSIGSVYESDEAEQFEIVLRAIANPGNIRAVKGAMITEIMNFSAQNISRLSETVSPDSVMEFDEYLIKFRKCNELWIKHSFVEMFNYFMSIFDIEIKLLSGRDGERKLTNIIHLAELLHQRELGNKSGISGLIAWFSMQRTASVRKDADETEIRLETDSDAVNIMTVHKSKGLEFPIVFCPFLWSITAIPFDEDKVDASVCVYHNEANESILNISGDVQALNYSYDEKLEELLRVFYVAVTRAKYQCYLLWGNAKSKTTSAMDYVFFADESVYNANKGQIARALSNVSPGRKVQLGTELLNTEQSRFIKLDAEPKDLKTVNKYTRQDVSSAKELICRDFDVSKLDRSWGINSFSGFTVIKNEKKDEFQEMSSKDYDSQDNKSSDSGLGIADIKDSSVNIFTFPAGAKTGTCWHRILECLDFTLSDDEIIKIVKEQIELHGLYTGTSLEERKHKVEVVTGMVKNVLGSYLPGTKALRLMDISNTDKIPEMEFHFPINNLNVSRIAEFIQSYIRKFSEDITLPELTSRTLNGFMCGFADLIFRHNEKYYIIDWKSNQLNREPSNFEIPGLLSEMARHYYFLQYLIYSVALDKYLANNLKDYSYDKNFGGVYYIFLRGVENNPDSKRGIFFDKPDKSRLEDFASILCERI